MPTSSCRVTENSSRDGEYLKESQEIANSHVLRLVFSEKMLSLSCPWLLLEILKNTFIK